MSEQAKRVTIDLTSDPSAWLRERLAVSRDDDMGLVVVNVEDMWQVLPQALMGVRKEGEWQIDPEEGIGVPLEGDALPSFINALIAHCAPDQLRKIEQFAEVEALRLRLLELSVVEERCDWEPDASPKFDANGDEREVSARVEDLVDALRAARAEVDRLRRANEALSDSKEGA